MTHGSIYLYVVLYVSELMRTNTIDGAASSSISNRLPHPTTVKPDRSKSPLSIRSTQLPQPLSYHLMTWRKRSLPGQPWQDFNLCSRPLQTKFAASPLPAYPLPLPSVPSFTAFLLSASVIPTLARPGFNPESPVFDTLRSYMDYFFLTNVVF